MITISLNQIKAKDPCEEGWKTILKARGGKNADYNEQFPLSFALDSNGLDDVLWSLQCLPEYNNLWRKYAVWCARKVEHLMTDQRSKDALDVAWRHSDGLATDDELVAAQDAAARAAARSAFAARGSANSAHAAAWATHAAGAARSAFAAAGAAAGATRAAAAAGDAARDAQTKKLREILDAGEWV